MKMLNLHSCHRRRSRRRGTAVVEFAVVLPVLCVILFGIIEYGYVLLVQQTLTNAAREGCRIAVLQSTTEPYAVVDQRIGEVMHAAGVTDYTVAKTHATLADPTESITIRVPYDSVSITGFFGSRGFNLHGNCSMRKEGM
jgi:Flp pilus assembly protein TadG